MADVETPAKEQQASQPPPTPDPKADDKPQDDWQAKYAALEKRIHAFESKTGRELAETKRENATLKKASDLPADVLERLADAEEAESELVERYGVDPELLKNGVTYAQKRDIAKRYAASVATHVATLRAELDELKKSAPGANGAQQTRTKAAEQSPLGGIASSSPLAVYKEALKSGKRLPSSEEIDRATAAAMAAK